MKRLLTIVILAFMQVIAFAQRGRGFRPEWDMERSHTHHSIDDDMWSLLLIIGAGVMFFLYRFIKGQSNQFKNKNNEDVKSYHTDKEEIDYSGEYIRMGYTAYELLSDNGGHQADSIMVEDEIYEEHINGWTQFGDAYSLEEIWGIQHPDLYCKIDGNLADVVAIYFASGEKALRIRIPFEDGTYKELKLCDKTHLEEGNQVDISTIVGFEMHKKGLDPIIRYNGELFYSTKVSPVERDITKKDKYGIKYSTDSKRLLYSSPSVGDFSIRQETVVICDKAFFMCKNLVSVSIPSNIRKIGADAFAFCPNLKSIIIPNSVIEIGEGVFSGCRSLGSIVIPIGAKEKFEKLLPSYKDKFTES